MVRIAAHRARKGQERHHPRRVGIKSVLEDPCSSFTFLPHWVLIACGIASCLLLRTCRPRRNRSVHLLRTFRFADCTAFSQAAQGCSAHVGQLAGRHGGAFIRSAMVSVGRPRIVDCGMNRRFRTRVREVDLFVRSSKVRLGLFIPELGFKHFCHLLKLLLCRPGNKCAAGIGTLTPCDAIS